MSRAATAARGRAPARRVSGPARPSSRGIAVPAAPRAVPRGRPIPAANPVAGAIGGLVRLGSQSLSSRWMDRMVRGQAWVVVIGLALIGIVAMQVSLLQLNTGIGRAVETKATLERSNAALRVQVSRLGTAENIQRNAAQRGLYMPSPGNTRYLNARPGGGDASRAVRSMRTPDPKPAVAAVAATPEAPVVGAEPPVPEGAEPSVPAPGEVPAPVPAPVPEPQAPADTAPAPVEPQTPQPAPVPEPAAAPTATSTGAVAAP